MGVGVLLSFLYVDPGCSNLAGSEMKSGGVRTLENFMGTPRFDVGRSLEHSGRRSQDFSPALEAGLRSECGTGV